MPHGFFSTRSVLSQGLHSMSLVIPTNGKRIMADAYQVNMKIEQGNRARSSS